MTTHTDSQLLRTYAEQRLEPAFTELVRRHVDFVYSAARRMVRDPHLAEDVTQGVFVALAKQASELSGRTTLAGWLHRTAQNIAAQTVRTIERRRAREQEAFAMSEPISTSPDVSWEQIEPHLDAALGELNDADRDAVVLRYFHKKSAAEIATLLGVSDDAAQKRVSRAVERLRDFFAKRGVTVGAGGLVVVISANAVQAAPVGLALAVATAATATGATLVTAATVTTTKAIAMTTTTKILLGTTLTIAIGAGLYQARQNSRLRAEVQLLQQQSAQQEREFNQERADQAVHLAALQTGNDRAETNAAELAKLRGEVARLRAQTATAVAPAPANLNALEANTNAPRAAVELPKDSWRDAGFASVESALQTRGWAVLNGNRERFKQSVFITPEAKQIMEKLLEDMINAAPAAERKKFSQMILDNNLGFEEAMLMPMMAENQAKGYAGYQILSQQTVSPDETVLQVATQMTAAPTKTETLRFRRFDNEWKLVVDEQFMNAHR